MKAITSDKMHLYRIYGVFIVAQDLAHLHDQIQTLWEERVADLAAKNPTATPLFECVVNNRCMQGKTLHESDIERITEEPVRSLSCREVNAMWIESTPFSSPTPYCSQYVHCALNAEETVEERALLLARIWRLPGVRDIEIEQCRLDINRWGIVETCNTQRCIYHSKMPNVPCTRKPL